MPRRLRIAVTADLHWGVRPDGDAATRRLAEALRRDPPDVFVVAGDVGAGDDFGPCLALFAGLPSAKAVVPGNHDLWVDGAGDRRGDSLNLYRNYLPALCKRHGFHYLDHGPLVLPDADFAVVGSVNWYDYSWAADRLKGSGVPDWRERLADKRFLTGRHNDARFVRWAHRDATFTAEVVAALTKHLRDALAQVGRVAVVTHHPPVRALNYPHAGPADFDALLWEAFSGNQALEELLAHWADRLAFVACGHTHAARSEAFHGAPAFNVGGDYDFKRLLRIDWPSLTSRAAEFRA